jgi:hypothetical protein
MSNDPCVDFVVPRAPSGAAETIIIVAESTSDPRARYITFVILQLQRLLTRLASHRGSEAVDVPPKADSGDQGPTIGPSVQVAAASAREMTSPATERPSKTANSGQRRPCRGCVARSNVVICYSCPHDEHDGTLCREWLLQCSQF